MLQYRFLTYSILQNTTKAKVCSRVLDLWTTSDVQGQGEEKGVDQTLVDVLVGKLKPIAVSETGKEVDAKANMEKKSAKAKQPITAPGNPLGAALITCRILGAIQSLPQRTSNDTVRKRAFEAVSKLPLESLMLISLSGMHLSIYHTSIITPIASMRIASFTSTPEKCNP